jgi:hypothetical protein
MKSDFEFRVVSIFVIAIIVFMRNESFAQRIPDAIENIHLLSSIAVGEAGDRQLIGADQESTDSDGFLKKFEAKWPFSFVQDLGDDRLPANTSSCQHDLFSQWLPGLLRKSIWALDSEYWLQSCCIQTDEILIQLTQCCASYGWSRKMRIIWSNMSL